MPAARKSPATSATPATIIAILGSDDGEIRRIAGERAAALAPPDAGDFGLDVIDGTADNTDQALDRLRRTVDALLTLPFFGGAKLVWLKGATFFDDSPTGKAEPVLEATLHFAELLQKGLPDGVRFLLSAFDIDKRRSFYKTLSKIAAIEVYDRIDTSKGGWEEQAMGLASDLADGAGLRFAPEALELFVQLAGADRQQMAHEIEKLDLYLGEERAITPEAVRLMVPRSRAGVIFELGNALARRDGVGAQRLLDELIADGESPIGLLLATIIPTVRNLLLARDLMERHRLRTPQTAWDFPRTLERLPAEATDHLPRKKDGGLNAYPLGFASMNAKRFSAAELPALLAACLETNRALVSSRGEPSVLLSTLVARITRPAGKG